MAESRFSGALLNVALAVGALVVIALVYGLATRVFTPRTTPTRADGRMSRVQVEVLNAAGVDGLAGRATDYLRRRGFDVVEIGNAAPRDTTTVLVRSGTALDARHVAQALGLGDSRVVTGGPTTDYSLDVTLFVGADYPTLSPFDDEP